MVAAIVRVVTVHNRTKTARAAGAAAAAREPAKIPPKELMDAKIHPDYSEEAQRTLPERR
jgi:hypothetical protein